MEQESLDKEIKIKIDKLIADIKSWNKKDVNELLDMITDANKLDNELDEKYLDDHIDWCDEIPTENLDNEDTAYPLWAMDKKGFCLVGDSIDGIEHISEIREKKMEITHTETIEHDGFQAFWDNGRNEYYADKNITICIDVELNGNSENYKVISLNAQVTDALNVAPHENNIVCFNTSINCNSDTDKLTDKELSEVTEFCQKIYNDYEYDVDGKIAKWVAEEEKRKSIEQEYHERNE